MKDHLDLSYRTDLTSLDEFITDDFTVVGDLNLFSCRSLIHLPNNLTVGGNLDLRLCVKLTNLPDNIKVDGNLDLRKSGINSLPVTLEVKGDIIVDKNFNIVPYRKESLFIKAYEREQVPIINGDIIVGYS